MSDGEEDFDGGYDGGDDTPEPEDTTSRSDVEEAVIRQRADRGDPYPRRGDTGHRSKGGELRGRADAGIGGNYEGLERYHDEARKNGTSIQNAIRDYAQVETAIRKDPVQGFVYAAQRMGLDPRQLAAAMHQHLFGPQGNQVASQAAQRFEYENHARSIEAFRADPANKYFDHVRMDMARLVQAGRATTLKQAYRLAIRNNPQLRVQEKIERSYGRH
jgi:hypothetical protein